jgi:uncharacterized protein (TIGR03086 family)
MDMDLLDLYGRASEWTGTKIAGVTDQTAATPCSEWTIRELLNHMLETQRYFAGAASGQDVSPPGPTPPHILSDDPVADFAKARSDVIATFSPEGVIEKTMPALGIAFADSLLHGWDVAKASGQDATMPEGLAETAYQLIHGRFTDDQRKGVFGPEIPAPDGASGQQRLLAYTGRTPD